tara:strand:- start:18539 stop:19009 length:471 start_codon:yes stop_codon:yes gene_type:complete
MPTKADTKYLNGIISQLSQDYDSDYFSPHITLYSPLCGLSKYIEENIGELSKNLLPVDVTVKKIGYTNNIWKTLFVDVEISPELTDIQSTLLNYIPNKKIYQFLPHISLIYKKLSLEQKKKIIKKIVLKKYFTMDKIAIVETVKEINDWKIFYLSK